MQKIMFIALLLSTAAKGAEEKYSLLRPSKREIAIIAGYSFALWITVGPRKALSHAVRHSYEKKRRTLKIEGM